MVLSEPELNDDSISHTHDSNSSTSVSTPLKPAIQKKTDDVSLKFDEKTEDIQVVYNEVPGPHKLIEDAQHSDLLKNSSTTKPIGFRNIKMKELPSEPSETAKKLFSMIQCGSFNKFTVMQPASRSLVCQLLNIVKLVNSQNAQNGVDTSVPSTYIITTKQENRGTEANKTIVSMETAEIVSLITKTVQSIKDGEFKKSENISIICGSPAIFLIKNVIIANSDRNMNSVYVITAENLLPYLHQLSTKIGKQLQKMPSDSNSSTVSLANNETSEIVSRTLSNITFANLQTRPKTICTSLQTKSVTTPRLLKKSAVTTSLASKTNSKTFQNSINSAPSLCSQNDDVLKTCSVKSRTVMKTSLEKPVTPTLNSSTIVSNNLGSLPNLNAMRQKLISSKMVASNNKSMLLEGSSATTVPVQAFDLTEPSSFVKNTGTGEPNVLRLNLATPIKFACASESPVTSTTIVSNISRHGMKNEKPANTFSTPPTILTIGDSSPRDVSHSLDTVTRKRKLDIEDLDAKDFTVPEPKRILDVASHVENQKNEIQILEKNILRKEREILSYKKKIQLLKKRYTAVKNPCDTKSDEQLIEEILNKYLDQNAVQFFVGQMKVSGKTYTQFRWSEEDKLFALGLLYKNPVEYHILFQKFTLPSDKTLSKFVSKVKKAEQATTRK